MTPPDSPTDIDHQGQPVRRRFSVPRLVDRKVDEIIADARLSGLSCNHVCASA